MPDIITTLRVPNYASAPGSPKTGQQYYDTTTNTLYFWNNTAWVAGDVTTTGVQTLTNKRINPRTISSATNNTTPTPDVSTADTYICQGMAVGMTFGSPIGTPTEAQRLVVRIEDNGTAQTIAWNAVYRASSDLSLPLTTTLGKVMYLGFMYNSTDSKWDLLAKLDNF